jgi:hypothetical protein
MPFINSARGIFGAQGKVTHKGGRNGLTAAAAAPSPKYLKNEGTTASGIYWFKNAGYNSGNAFQAYADLSIGDGFIITCGYAISNDGIVSWSQWGTEATSNSGTPGYKNNFYTNNSILTGWTGDTSSRFILGQTSNSGTDISSAGAKNWFVLNISPGTAKAWFDNNPGTPEFNANVIASSTGSGLTNYSWSSTHGNSIWQMYRTSGGGVNSRLWMETRTGGGDTNHTGVVFSTGEGNYYKGNGDTGGFGGWNYYRWLFMGFSPDNMV